MAFKVNGSQRTAMAEINVTPLVDVMLVLLIIFMVTAPMMQEGVSVDLPAAQGKPLERRPDTEEVVISIRDKGGIFVNDKAVKESELTQTVLNATKKSPSTQVFLRADKNVAYGVVVRTMAALKGAGIANLGVITTPSEDSGTAQ